MAILLWILLFVSSIHFVYTDPTNTVMENTVRTSFQTWKEFMKTSFPSGGIPVLDPFRVPLPITVKTAIFILGYLRVTLSNITFFGLSTFEVRNLSSNRDALRVSYDNYVSTLSVRSNYSVAFIPFGLLPIQLSDGFSIATVNGTNFNGMVTLLPKIPNLFTITSISVNLTFQSFSFRVYPNQISNPITDKLVTDSFYNTIQSLNDQISKLMKLSYSKSVGL